MNNFTGEANFTLLFAGLSIKIITMKQSQLIEKSKQVAVALGGEYEFGFKFPDGTRI